MKNCRNIFLALAVYMVVLYGTAKHVYTQEPGNNIQQPETITSVESSVQELSPQLQKEKPKPEASRKEPSDPIKIEEKDPTKLSDPTQKTDTAKGYKVDSKSLLSITDGPFRYSRIPGITIKENNEQIVAKIEEEKQDIESQTGLFGLSKQASDRMAKIILVVIIVFVFILYRMRTRNTSSSVLRRFPK